MSGSDNSMSVPRLRKVGSSIQKTLNTSNDRLGDQCVTKKTLYVLARALSEQSHHGEPREDRSLKPAVAVPASFPVLRRVGYITAQDMPECWMHHYSKAYAGPSLHSGHFSGWSPPSSHDLSGTAGRGRDRASNRAQETPSAVANQPTSASGWTHHPGRRIGNVGKGGY